MHFHKKVAAKSGEVPHLMCNVHTRNVSRLCMTAKRAISIALPGGSHEVELIGKVMLEWVKQF